MNHASSCKPALAVLAAGMGSRYGGLKQIDPVGPHGEIILDYSIFDALRGGFDQVVFIIRKDLEKTFREAVGKRWESRVRIEYAFQELDRLPAPFGVPADRVKPWGTGHAVLCAQEKLTGPFAVINADDFYGRSGFAELGAALSAEHPANRHFMVGFALKNTLSEFGSVSRGICSLDNAGFLKEVVEHTKIEPSENGGARSSGNGAEIAMTGEEVTSMNMWGFQKTLFDSLGSRFEEFLKSRGTELKSEFYLPAAVAEMIRSGNADVEVLKSRDAWFGVTYREDKPRVQQSILELIHSGAYPENLFS